MPIYFPFNCRPRDVDFRKSNSSGPERLSITGRNVAALKDAGFWRARVVFQVIDEDTILAARAFAAAVDGMATEIILPAVPEHRPKTIYGQEVPRFNRGPLGNGTFEMGGVINDEPEYMTLRKPASLRDTRIKINHSGMLGLRPGHYFGIRNRLYCVSRVWSDGYEMLKTVGGSLGFKNDSITFGGDQVVFGSTRTKVTGEAVQNVEFWPPLRDDVDVDTQIVVGNPVCRMLLTSDEGLAVALDRGIHGRVEFELRESL